MKTVLSILFLLFSYNTVTGQSQTNYSWKQATLFDSSFSSYRPTYLGITAFSSEDLEVQLKFQFSIKYEIVEGYNFYFGYTQKSFWSIQEPSAPFAETNFNPEAFWNWRSEKWPSWLKEVQIGLFRHESTGEAGFGSHGWNTQYVEPKIILGDFLFVPVAWIPAFMLSNRMVAPDNQNIFRYMGFFQLNFIYHSDLNQVSWMIGKGTKSSTNPYTHFQYNIDLKNILSILNWKIKWNPSLFLQLWAGNGESLKNYNKETGRITVGISLSR